MTKQEHNQTVHPGQTVDWQITKVDDPKNPGEKHLECHVCDLCGMKIEYRKDVPLSEFE
jgi:hypothetical protein